ncbi:hypothetical protein KQX63_06725 [Rhodopseudomonas palustris]|uniref:hypothetical protein n=1 Tax=Rhodopseudomonas palustris TaxID=1076 RepID=UPI0021F34947|nr:hypothetical protein [Rhodopseudomonas palustris]UYO45702.1 hypothetical protein KQX63_06725 [Rhodopseudomonas palustris]UYO55134.1 hypothetical protein KQX61_06945 [Rhodopseudomonas palustris]
MRSAEFAKSDTGHSAHLSVADDAAVYDNAFAPREGATKLAKAEPAEAQIDQAAKPSGLWPTRCVSAEKRMIAGGGESHCEDPVYLART